MPRKNDWFEYKKLMLDFKQNTEAKLDLHDKKLDKLLETAAGMKVKIAVGSSVISGIVAYLVASLS